MSLQGSLNDDGRLRLHNCSQGDDGCKSDASGLDEQTERNGEYTTQHPTRTGKNHPENAEGRPSNTTWTNTNQTTSGTTKVNLFANTTVHNMDQTGQQIGDASTQTTNDVQGMNKTAQTTSEPIAATMDSNVMKQSVSQLKKAFEETNKTVPTTSKPIGDYTDERNEEVASRRTNNITKTTMVSTSKLTRFAYNDTTTLAGPKPTTPSETAFNQTLPEFAESTPENRNGTVSNSVPQTNEESEHGTVIEPQKTTSQKNIVGSRESSETLTTNDILGEDESSPIKPMVSGSTTTQHVVGGKH